MKKSITKEVVKDLFNKDSEIRQILPTFKLNAFGWGIMLLASLLILSLLI